MTKIKILKKSVKNKTKAKNKKAMKKKIKLDFSKNEEEVKQSVNESSNDKISSDDDSLDASDGETETIFDHKKSLQSLKEKDPEFYDFLQQNDRDLLDFQDEDQELDDDEVDDEGEYDAEQVSDISIKRIDELSEKLSQSSDFDSIRTVITWFRKAVNQTSDESDSQLISPEKFNAIVNVCLIDLLPAIRKFLRLQDLTANQTANETKMIDPTKSRNWKRINALMKSYLTDVLKIVSSVSEPSLQATLLRHILHLIPFYAVFPHMIKRLLRQAIVMWSEGEEKNRVLSFLCILRLMRTQDQPLLSYILKKLYISYVKNCKFTTQSSWPLINFMRQSLVELYCLDQTLAYQHGFVFIKQLAINLRTALTVKKKESFKTVYNWQYLHSILLWSHLLSFGNTSDELKPLICPLVNVMIGTIKLVPSAKYFPLRFHLINALIKLSDETNTFIPILPLITEVLDLLDKNKKQKSNEQKETKLDLLIKIPNVNCSDFEFRNAIIQKVYDLILFYLSTQSHHIGFPELVFVTLNKMRKFVKNYHIIQHNQMLKQLMEKIEENSRMINDKRKSVSFTITDSLAIDSWQRDMKSDETPLLKFYNHRNKIKNQSESSQTVLINDLLENNHLSDGKPILNKVDVKVNEKNSLKRKNPDSSNKKRKNKRSKKLKKYDKKQINKKVEEQEFSLTQAFDLSSDEDN